jgi:hypothetical protein
MDKNETVTAKTVFDFSIGRFVDPDKSDLLILTLRIDGADLPFAMDRRMSERLSADLAKIAKKLSAPKHEN